MSIRSRWSHQKGFTLLELLVVISIIGLLIAMGTVAFTTAQSRGRDAKRRADLQSIQKAQEQYFAANASQYLAFGSSCPGSITGSMDVFPEDPRTPTTTYSCEGTTGAYCVAAELDDDTSGNCGGCSLSGGVYSFTAGTTHYCVKNLQ